MDSVFQNLLLLMVVVWSVAVLLRRVGLPTIMGELLMGVILGPAVLGWVEPNELIEILAQMGIFFLMLHTGVETEPRQFFAALKVSLGVAVVGALVPFAVAFGVALAFGQSTTSAVFVGLTMSATAVVVTLKILKDLGLERTRFARVIVASGVIDGLVSLVMFSVVLGIVREGSVDPISLLIICGKVAAYFAAALAVGYWLYPQFQLPFRSRRGEGFAFILVLGLGFGLIAEAIGLHIILGAYLAGLFFEEKIADEAVVASVSDRLEGVAYTFLGPIFFISLGFHITFDALTGGALWFILALTAAVAVGQVLSAGAMGRVLKFSWVESAAIGVGMCGRAEMAFVLASLGLSLGAFDAMVFTVVIFTTFLLNMVTPVGLSACAAGFKRQTS
ncbi:MAG: cation:proton antiporter [Alphaproteobacteria bacterium]|nr:cation:proton antiporter [Alphaproteobacteria bacterium]